MSNKVKVLIVEDDFLIADMAEEFLVQHGLEVCGIASTVEAAVALGRRHKPDLAMIDYRLADGGLGTEVGIRLRAAGDVGILYATGNYAACADAVGEGSIGKPYSAEALIRSLEVVGDIRASGATLRPLPLGFRLLKGARLRRAEPPS